jgi:hypothetical protein
VGDYINLTGRVSKSIALTIILLLALPLLALGVDKKGKEKKNVPKGRPILWKAPDDLPSRDLFLGPGGAMMKPDTSSVTFLKADEGGYSKESRKIIPPDSDAVLRRRAISIRDFE